MPLPTAPPSQSQGAVQAFGEAPVHFSFQICRADGGRAAGLVDGLSEYGYKATKELLRLYRFFINFFTKSGHGAVVCPARTLPFPYLVCILCVYCVYIVCLITHNIQGK